jgi:RNA 2',3'-cyclic 3'-phosphodiesterase
MAATSQRLFVAIGLPEPVRTVLAQLAQPLPDVAWTRPEQLHLTLRFLGDIDAEQKDTVVAKLRTVQVAPFVLPIEGSGTFPPNAPPRVLWAGVGSGHPRLFQLRQRLDDALLAAGVQFDVRIFHPHVTLARCQAQAGRSIAGWLHRHREFVAPPFLVDAFELYASELHPGGAIHTLVDRFPLAN